MRLPSLRRGPDAVSPTAHYTGHVWVRNGLSHPELATREGPLLYAALAPANTLSRLSGGPTLEGMLLARHRVIDDVLADHLRAGRVRQVLELACGMSPRGWRFAERFGGEIAYVEADLPAMAGRKREALTRIGAGGAGHRVAEVDVLEAGGPHSLEALAGRLDPEEGLAIITEGLLTYLDDETVAGLWARLARVLAGFARGVYLSDLRLAGDRARVESGFNAVLSAFVRGRVHPHFADEAEAEAALRLAGFAETRLHRGDRHPAGRPGDAGAALIHVIEART